MKLFILFLLLGSSTTTKSKEKREGLILRKGRGKILREEIKCKKKSQAKSKCSIR